MTIKIIYSVKRMYDAGREIPGHNHAHSKWTRGVLLIHDGHVSVRGCHQRPTLTAQLVTEDRGQPIAGFRMHDVRVTKMTAECVMIYGLERDDVLGVHDHGQAWWCVPVDSVPLAD
jgi:hypothetical protein